MADDAELAPIVDSLWLQTQLGQPGLKLIDVRHRDSYRQEHIPGAAHFDIEQINIKRPPVTGLLPEPAAFNDMMSAIGLSKSDLVIVYDDAGGPAAARLAWTLKAFGHGASAMLDAGFNGWLATGAKTDTLVPTVGAIAYRAQIDSSRIADRNYIRQSLHKPETVLLDTRSLAEYEGTDRRAARGGHIPGAVHFDWNWSKDAGDNHFKPAVELLSKLEASGVMRDREIICYCQSHQRSSVICLLLEALGYPNVKGYPGAWSDWGNAADTPIE
ncbi:MAG TPA: sulfurtransferase [Gammaproteobacteria bacterium]